MNFHPNQFEATTYQIFKQQATAATLPEQICCIGEAYSLVICQFSQSPNPRGKNREF